MMLLVANPWDALRALAWTERAEHAGRVVGLLRAHGEKLHDLDAVGQDSSRFRSAIIHDPSRSAHDVVLNLIDDVFELPAFGVFGAKEEFCHSHTHLLIRLARIGSPALDQGGEGPAMPNRSYA